MIKPINEKLFKKWANINGYAAKKHEIDYAAQIEQNVLGHITNTNKALEIIQQLQVEINKLQTANHVCIQNTLDAVAALLTHHHGFSTHDPIIKAILALPHESVKSV